MFLPRPDVALRAYLGSLQSTEAQLEKSRATLIAAKERFERARSLPRLERMLAGMQHNMAVMKDICGPIHAHLKGRDVADDFLGWASIQTGLSPHDMFIYFYHDWYGVPAFERVKALFRTAVAEHCKDREQVAVLGAGGCGLAHALADQFERSIAIDLSLPGLLMASRFLEGEPLTMHLKEAGWRQVSIAPPAAPRGALELMAANITSLPFPDASLSMVVTQCLLDVIDNPVQLAEEIRRVLRPDGLWMSFSHSFPVPGEPAEFGLHTLEEVPVLLQSWGFEPQQLERKRWVMLNTTHVEPAAHADEHDVHFFVAHKLDRSSPPHFRTLRREFASKGPALWSRIPAVVGGMDLTLSDVTTYKSDQSYTTHKFGVGRYSLPLPQEYAQVLRLILDAVDGQRSLREVFTILGSKLDLPEQRFVDLIYCMSVERNVLELRSAAA
ncbi:class I SAM-dependent methyltransferase [Sorangium sp. So ce429]